MITKNDVIRDAAKKCLEELFSKAQPSITYEEIKKLNVEYSKSHKDDEPIPCDFYYLPSKVFKEICDSYVYAYDFDKKQDLLNTIETLVKYCNNPIISVYREANTDEYGNYHPGYKDYERTENILNKIKEIVKDEEIAAKCVNTFIDLLTQAGNFFSWNSDLNCFNTTVYLGCSPFTNKEKVIENWKKYRNKDIEIDETKYDYEEGYEED